MASLTGQTIKQTYQGLLKTAGDQVNIGSGGTARNIVDGEETTSALWLSDTRVGIGTGGPEELLQVEGASGLDGATPPTIKIHSSNAGTWTDNATFARLAFGNEDSDTNDNIACSINAYVDSVTGNNAGLSFYTSAAANTPLERMRINNSGYIGVNELTPDTILHLSELHDSGAGATLTLSNPSAVGATTPYVGIKAILRSEYNAGEIRFGKESSYSPDSAANSYMAFYTANANTNNLGLYIDNGGKVGIGGEADPNNALEVFSATSATKIEITCNASGTSELLFSDNNSGRGRIYFNHGSSPEGLAFESATVQSMFINNAGSIGMGTVDPKRLLHLVKSTGSGTAAVWSESQLLLEENDSIMMEMMTPNNKFSGIAFTDSGAGAQAGAMTFDHGTTLGSLANTFAWRIGSGTANNKMVLDGGGKLGIGTLVPNKQLHVEDVDGGNLFLSRYDTTIEPTNSLGQIFFAGTENKTAWGEVAKIQGISDEVAGAWAEGSKEGGSLHFHTTAIDSAAIAERLEIRHDGDVDFKKNSIVDEQSATTNSGLKTSGPHYRFSGSTTEGIIVSDHSSIDLGANNYSISVWVKATSFAGLADRVICVKSGTPTLGNTATGLLLGLDAGRVLFENRDGSSRNGMKSNTILTTGRWYHIVAGRDVDGAGTAYMWINGVSEGTLVAGGTGSNVDCNVDNSADLLIGPDTSGSPERSWNGSIANFSIYNKLLSDAEVLEIYQTGSVPDELRAVKYLYTGSKWDTSIDGWTQTRLTLTYNQTGTDEDALAKTECLKGVLNSGSNTHYFMFGIENFRKYKEYRVRCAVLLPNANATAVGFRINADTVFGGSNLVYNNADGSGKWVLVDTIHTAGDSNVGHYTIWATAGDGSTVNADGDIVYVKDWQIDGVGAVLELDSSTAGVSRWKDKSANKNHGVVKDGTILENASTKTTELTNLAPNSGFEVWSDSTFEPVIGAANLVIGDDADFDVVPGNWTASGGTILSVGGGQAGNCLQLTRSSGGNQYAVIATPITVVGKLYRVAAYVKTGSSGNEAFSITVNNSSGTLLETVAGDSTGSWVQHTVAFVATTTTTQIRLNKLTATAGTMLFDTVEMYEYTPATINTGNVLAPDGWRKDASNVILYREPPGNIATTQYGTTYGIRAVYTTGANIEIDNYTDLAWLDQVKGNHVALGAWCKTDMMEGARVRLYDGTTSYFSTYHTGSGEWEWLEVSAFIPTNATRLETILAMATTDVAAGTAYWCQPMLVLGDYIGEGNYVKPAHEVIDVKSPITLREYAGSAVAADFDFNLESQSLGKIPKTARAVETLIKGVCASAFGRLEVTDTAGNGGPVLTSWAVTSEGRAFGRVGIGVDTELGDASVRIQRLANYTGVHVVIHAIELSNGTQRVH